MPSRTPLAVRLTSERNMRINDRFTARARMRKLLDGDIARMLRTAQDALGNDPCYVSVARERISRTLELIADECAKLAREDAPQPRTALSGAPPRYSPEGPETMDRLTWTCATFTGTRDRNEDSFRWRHAPSLALDGDHPVAVVCDGLGGHAHGEIASNTAAEAFMQEYLTGSPAGATVPERLLAAVHAANDAIGERCRQDPKLHGMGTTLVAAAVTAEGLWRIGVGDSPLRVWSRRNGELRKLGKRHNVAGHPHRLSSALQGWEIPEIDAPFHAAPLRKGDAVILASDGLDTLSAETISEIAAADADMTGSDLAWSLVEAVIAADRKKQDNTTAACLRTPEDTGHQPDTIRAVRGDAESEVTISGQPLDWRASLAVRNHSPSGVEWGYHGSGPSQLALAILLAITDRETAERRYQEFKREIIARISEPEWTLPLRDVRCWLRHAAAADAAH